ncbi:NADH-ubiquinone oxidoreductase-like protein 2 [Elsinoe australis]|uniref:NADH-ubiquinone oxidoreductase-like protein 2 n=1 Tax=Elsinoe australis TaxID=40998 RepID=A0A4U7B9X4_9PEZI|nr:NADH-ubiquinone oxidoreductase-like protein 2 [Elsinoe australis]
MGQDPKVNLGPEPSESPALDVDNDPRMNGQYPEVPRVKRSLRDPYDNWWDPQERRNYGEPIHEDNDILGVFSTEPYTHFTTSWGWVLMGTFVGTVLTLCGAVAVYYPDKPSVPRTFPGGLETELGGPGALPARSEE